jgi:NAD(P)-dependent dehydrogenase (short-subunit alcohol dehydrogenase family)
MSGAPSLRTVVVTGAGSGIGRATAIRLSDNSGQVLALDRDEQSAAETVRILQAQSGHGLAAACDVTDESAIETAIGTLDRVDVLVNSAGIFGEKRLEEITADDLRRMYEVGPVRTPMLSGLGDERLEQLAAGYPGGRLIEAEDVAHAISFFADPATRFITGQVLIIDGGRSLGLSSA